MTRTIPFADDFWEVRYKSEDVRAYKRYLKIVNLSKQGHTAASIERILRTNNVSKYLRGQKKSFLVNLEEWRERLGPPTRGFRWLPIRLKPRGTPDNEWIQVPSKIKRFPDVWSVLDQRPQLEDANGARRAFAFETKDEPLAERINLFGFLLGAMIGDASKPAKGQSRFPSMTVALTLSKAKANSIRFGRFSAACMEVSLGLRMPRIRDAEPSARRFTNAECYRWVSQSSPLVGWVFRVCLGLKEGETTTWDAVDMRWILRTSKSFLTHFMQGLAESDGHVDAGRDRVCIVSSPNTRLIVEVLRKLGVNPKVYSQPPIERVEIPTADAAGLPIFSERVCSKNHKNMQIMAKAKRFPPRRQLSEWFVKRIPKAPAGAINYSQACLMLAKTTGYKISNKTMMKYSLFDGQCARQST
ncbi:MAG: hypothetical protein LYZ66_01475 [Nitrososphaerales archaeon]|nr:hypothetical protein [Nitrososphaerales archaeon]